MMSYALIIGDSQAAGPMGARLEALLRSAGYTTQRMGEVGWTADRWIADRAADARAAAAGADVVFVVLGTNDIYRSDRTQPSAQWFKDLGPNVWWVGAPNYQDANLQARVDGTMPIFKRVFGGRYIDSRLFTNRDCVGRTPDCVHFLASSGAGWGSAVYAEWKRRTSSIFGSLPTWTGPLSLALGVVALVIGFRRRRGL